MQNAAEKLRKKLEDMNDSLEDQVIDENLETKKTKELELAQTYPHWKYTGAKDTIENAWKQKDSEKALPRNIDLIDDRQKLKQLDDAIKICTKNLVESRANLPWMYTGPKDTVENMVQVDHVRDWVPKKYIPNDESSGDEGELSLREVDDQKKELQAEKEAKKLTKQMHPSVPRFNVKEKTRMYEKEYSDIKKYPWKIKYEEFMEDNDQAEDDDDEDNQSMGGFSDDSDKKKTKKPPIKSKEKQKKKNRTPSDMTPDETISEGGDFGF